MNPDQQIRAQAGISEERLSRLAPEVCRLAREAGEKVMECYREGSAFRLKKDASPLTAADEASHQFLVKYLPSLIADVPVVSEESSDGINGLSGNGCFWLVDPLDGTKEFVKRTNEFTVNVALIEGDTPVLGVVHAPALDLTYYGSRTFGAWRQIDGQPATRISTRRADFSRLAVVASKDHAGPLVRAMLAQLSNPRVQSMGSSLKFCLVAEGRADLYLRDLPTMEWDTAAAQCIVGASGGGVYTLNGERLRYGKAGLRNPAIMTVGDTEFNWRPLVTKDVEAAACSRKPSESQPQINEDVRA